MVQFYGDKCYFEEKVQGYTVKARTACLVLRYKDTDDNLSVLTILDSPIKKNLEFPGGKVELTDRTIIDTLIRESWEEIILKDDLGKTASIKDWQAVYNQIITNDDVDSKLFAWIISQIPNCCTTSYGNSPLRTVYYIVDISEMQAHHLIQNHGMIPVSINLMKTIVQFNKKTKERGVRFTRRTTYFHIGGDSYRFRGRDFEGMFKYLPILEKPTKRAMNWATCRSLKISTNIAITVP